MEGNLDVALVRPFWSVSMEQHVILVNERDEPVGFGDKMGVHLSGKLHRAFSIFLFNDMGQWLLQRRHPDKYHSGGLWTNACCSHPAPGEETAVAARKRLKFEMGIEVPLLYSFSFRYRAELDNNLIEHELDHVFLGDFQGTPSPHPEEVSEWRWVATASLLQEMEEHPEQFTFWFRRVARRVLDRVAVRPEV
jgi:isopentenyl-diphosphate Delta-isomerase